MDKKKLQPQSSGNRLDDRAHENIARHGELATATDGELVGRTRAGDVAALEELFRRHHKRVYNIALRVLSNESDAADVTQEVFVRVFQTIKSLKADDAFSAWLKIMTINRCRDVIRKQSRVRVDSLDASLEASDGSSVAIEIPDSSNSPEDEYDKAYTKEVVRKAIGALSPDYREVVSLFYLDNSSVTQIVDILGVPEGTVKSRLSRARAELKRKLEHLLRQ